MIQDLAKEDHLLIHPFLPGKSEPEGVSNHVVLPILALKKD